MFAQPGNSGAPAPTGRQVSNFNADWKFSKGDPEDAHAADFNDSNWQAVRLPHDWAIAGPFDPNVDGFAGKLPWQGIGWYRKTFTISGPAGGRRVYLDFDGVMAFPEVYVNGQFAGQWDYGYMSFRVEATPPIKFDGQPNVVAVRVDTTHHGTRWYPGAGIYRKVTLSVSNPIHIGHWATLITTPTVTDASATVGIKTTVENHTLSDAPVEVAVMLSNAAGQQVARGSASQTAGARGWGNISLSLPVATPRRWDVDDPHLYTAKLTVRSNGAVVDEESIPFGIRTYELTANDGFHLNGRRVQLYGVNLHHDHGPLGGAFFTRAMERQLEIMKDMGVNAVRTSHNAPAPELLDLCDRMGIVVWDECFDKWNETADRMPPSAAAERRERIRSRGDQGERGDRGRRGQGGDRGQRGDRGGRGQGERGQRGDGRRGQRGDGERGPRLGRSGDLEPDLLQHAENQLRNLVMRDRNHASVIVWSIANEVGGVGGRDGLTHERVSFMRDVVRRYDPTRPVGLGHHVVEHGGLDVFSSLDFVGYNYDRRYRLFRETYPQKPIIYSESASALSTRGYFDLPLPTSKTDYSAQHQVDSYDYNAARWSDIADLEFDLMERDKFVAGEFVWTGFDYLGEPTPFAKEARSSYFGIVDTCGFPKDRYYLYRAHWRPDVTTVHILPHWNWPERAGQPVPVFVYTNGDSAELFLNGRSLGRRQKKTSVPRRADLAEGKSVTASSSAERTPPSLVVDNRNTTIWRAASNEPGQWFQVDLGAVHPMREIMVAFADTAANYKFQIKVSSDGNQWQTVVDQNEFVEGMGNRLAHGVDTNGRHVRVEFGDTRGPNTAVGLRDVFVYPAAYHDITDKYRLKWMDVAYEPGELRAVAYKGNTRIGEATVRTTGAPSALRLTADRRDLAANGDDLCYVTVEAVDNHGDVHPLASNLVRFTVAGPADIAGVDNGDPLSMAPIQAPQGKLFFGKSLVILRTRPGAAGEIRLRAESDGLTGGSATATAR
jgi:beta-galactosidase